MTYLRKSLNVIPNGSLQKVLLGMFGYNIAKDPGSFDKTPISSI